MGVTVFESVSPTLAHSAYRLYIQESFCANIKNSTHLNSENTTPAPVSLSGKSWEQNLKITGTDLNQFSKCRQSKQARRSEHPSLRIWNQRHENEFWWKTILIQIYPSQSSKIFSLLCKTFLILNICDMNSLKIVWAVISKELWQRCNRSERKLKKMDRRKTMKQFQGEFTLFVSQQ